MCLNQWQGLRHDSIKREEAIIDTELLGPGVLSFLFLRIVSVQTRP